MCCLWRESLQWWGWQAHYSGGGGRPLPSRQGDMRGRDGRLLFWLQGLCSGEGGRVTAVVRVAGSLQ